MFSWLTALRGALLVLAWLAGAMVMHGCDQRKYESLDAKYNQFKGGVEATGREAFRRSEIQTANDIKLKKEIDAKDKKRAVADAASIASLRQQLDAARDSSGGVVPPSPAGSVCPDGLACYDRAALESALRGLTSEVRGLADEGAKVERELGTAREWDREVNP